MSLSDEIFSRLGGTLASFFKIAAIAIKNSAGVAEFRNSTDTAYVDIKAKTVSAANLIYDSPTGLTIASDIITVTQGYHSITSETGAADDLKKILGGTIGQIVYLGGDGFSTITLISAYDVGGGSSNIWYKGADLTLTSYSVIGLIFTGTYWVPLPDLRRYSFSNGLTEGTVVNNVHSVTLAASGGAGNMLVSNGGGWVVSAALLGVSQLGLRLVSRLSASSIKITDGYAEVNGVAVPITQPAILGPANASDWLSGSVDEAANQHIYVYVDGSGNVKLSPKAPIYPTPRITTPKFVGLINQAGWNGTAGNGLNATTITYDGDTGESSLLGGEWLGICTSADTDYSIFRGYGSASAGGTSVSSQFAKINGNSTIINRITLDAGHNIGIRDNDRIFAIDGAPLYRYESSVWWRCIGSVYNDGSSNLRANHLGNAFYVAFDNGTNYTTTSTTFAAIDSTNLGAAVVCAKGGPMMFNLQGNAITSNDSVQFDMEIDGIRYAAAGASGMAGVASTTKIPFTLAAQVQLPPGPHTFIPQFRQAAAGTGTVYSGVAGTPTFDFVPSLSIVELP